MSCQCNVSAVNYQRLVAASFYKVHSPPITVHITNASRPGPQTKNALFFLLCFGVSEQTALHVNSTSDWLPPCLFFRTRIIGILAGYAGRQTSRAPVITEQRFTVSSVGLVSREVCAFFFLPSYSQSWRQCLCAVCPVSVGFSWSSEESLVSHIITVHRQHITPRTAVGTPLGGSRVFKGCTYSLTS